jgi:carotenoid cleavage dioxygenase-like enzyme
MDLSFKGEGFINGPYAARYSLHLDTGAAECALLTPPEQQHRVEFPVAAAPLLGHRQRFAYCCALAEKPGGRAIGAECALPLPAAVALVD